MSKLIKRIGTSSTKFAIEIHLTKVEIKLVQKCSVMVAFKRGDHEKETKEAAPLNNGAALFDEKLSFPATLYYVKKKDGYLPKEAVLELYIITPTTKRLAGITKFDLAHYVNLGVQEQDVELKVGKCFDKDAKFHFRLHMIQLSDVSTGKKETPFSRKPLHHTNISDESSEGPSIRKSRLNNNTQPQTLNILPDLSLDSKQFDGYASVQDPVRSSRLSRRPKSPGSRNNLANLAMSEQLVPNRRSKTVDMYKDSEDSLDLSGPHIEATNPNNQTYSQNEIIMEVPNLENKVSTLEEKVKFYEFQTKQLEERASQGNQHYLNLFNEFQQMKQKYEQAKQNWTDNTPQGHYSPENTQGFDIQSSSNQRELEERIHELSEKVRQLVATHQELEEQNHSLRSQLEESNHKIANINAEGYEQRIHELQQKLHASESNTYSNEGQLQELQRRLKEAESRAERSERHAKEVESRLHEIENRTTESQISHSQNLKSKDRQIEDIQFSLKKAQESNQEKIQKIEDLESQIQSYESEIDALKTANMTNASNEEQIRHLTTQLEALEHRNKTSEENHKKRIDELSKQNGEMKREIEQLKSNLNAKEIEKENATTQFGLENEKLKRQVKELNAKILTMQYEGNEIEHLRENIQELKTRNDSLEAELSKLKMSWAAVEVEKDNMELCFKESEDNNRIRQERLELMEMELFKLKTRFGDLVNAAMESGDDQLLDKLENIISGEGLETIRSMSRHSRRSEV